MKAKLVQDVRQLRAEYNKAVEIRKKMQEKLRQIYVQNKENRNQYRDQNRTNSAFASPSIQNSRSGSSISSTSGSRSGREMSVQSGSGVMRDFFNHDSSSSQDR